MTLQNTVHYCGKSGQESDAGAKAEIRGIPLSGAHTLPGCYLSYTFQTQSSGNAPHTVAWILLHQLETKKIPYRLATANGRSDVSNAIAIPSSQERVGCARLTTANSVTHSPLSAGIQSDARIHQYVPFPLNSQILAKS